jgi:hypothetical protein
LQHLATSSGDIQKVVKLLEIGANPNIKGTLLFYLSNSFGYSILYEVTYKFKKTLS